MCNLRSGQQSGAYCGKQILPHPQIPVIFTSVSADADHGYVFVQEASGPCFGCLFPDALDSRTYACPATPAIADILQAVGALTVYAVDSCLMNRREVEIPADILIRREWDGATVIERRSDCLWVNH